MTRRVSRFDEHALYIRAPWRNSPTRSAEQSFSDFIGANGSSRSPDFSDGALAVRASIGRNADTHRPRRLLVSRRPDARPLVYPCSERNSPSDFFPRVQPRVICSLNTTDPEQPLARLRACQRNYETRVAAREKPINICHADGD